MSLLGLANSYSSFMLQFKCHAVLEAILMANITHPSGGSYFPSICYFPTYHCTYQHYFIVLRLCICSPLSLNSKLLEDRNFVIIISPASRIFDYRYSENVS